MGGITLTLSTLAKVLKAHSINTSKSNEDFLNDLLRPYADAARVKGPGNTDFHLDKTRTSKLLAGKMDVPAKLREGLERYGIEESVELNMAPFVEECLDRSGAERLKQDVLDLAGDDRPSRERLDEARGDLPRFLARALLTALRNPNIPTNGGTLWSRGTGSLAWREGDIFGLGSRGSRPSIVVIPVNTSFDAHVTRKKEGVAAPLVSPGTLHGKWLERMVASGAVEGEIAARVLSDLDARGIPRDTRGRFPVGTVAVIEHGGVTYYLLALSDFGDDNRARCDAEGVRTALASLADFYDRNGQGDDIYLPLIGTGMSRAGLTYRESLDLIVDAFTGSGAFLAGKATVVVTPEAAADLGLGE